MPSPLAQPSPPAKPGRRATASPSARKSPRAKGSPAAGRPAPAADRLSLRHQKDVAFVAGGVTAAVASAAMGADLMSIDTWFQGALQGMLTRIQVGYSANRNSSMDYLRRHAALSGARVEPHPGSLDVAALRQRLQITGPVGFKTAIAAGQDPASARRHMATNMGGVADETVRNGDRDVITQTARFGNGVVGWRRRLSGHACGFCAMLASRGAVYANRQGATVAKTRELYHPHCHCWAEPLYAHQQEPAGVRRLQGQWQRVTSGHSGKDAQRVWRSYWEKRQPAVAAASQPGGAAAEGVARRVTTAPPQVRDVLAQAKTVHDVEYAFWEETGRIRGVRLKYEDIDFTGSSVQTAREHAEGVLRGLERFPDAKLRSVGTADFRSTSYAEATGPDIRFATRWSSPAARGKYLRTIDEDVASGYHGPPASPVTVAVHEFGHVVDLWSLGRAARPEIQALLEREAAARGVEVGELIRSEISGYAERSADELVAEAFADVVMNGEAASSLSREILGMVEAQYRKGGGRAGVAERVASAPKPAPHSPKPVEGRDLLAATDEPALARQIIEDSRAYDHSADAGLSAIAHEQGFDGLPRVVSAEEMDRLYAQGGVRMTRGIHAGSKRNVPRPGERRKTAVEIQDEMREGPAYFGNGNAGSGYTFAVGDYHGQVPVEYSDGTPGSIVRATLAPDAKIASLADLRADYDRIAEAEGWTGFRPRVGWMNPTDEVGMPDAIRVFGDPGRLAAARGYDGFWVTPDHEIVVVNRTKLIVERRPANAAKPTPAKKAAPAKKAVAPKAPKPPTTASLAKKVRDAGITVPTGLRRPALEQLVKDLEAGTDAATARARALVTIGDERRATAKLLSDVDAMLANKASDRAIATLAADVERALPAEVKARDVLAAALRSGDRDQIRAAMAALEQEAKLKPMPGKAGDVVKLDRKTMQVQGGARLADGAEVEVIRPGYTTVIEGQTVRVPPVVAQVSEQTRNRLARVALRERQAFIDARTPAANLLAELDRDLALNQDAAVIREHLNAKIWPGIDPKVVDRLAAAYKRDGVEGLRKEIGKVSTAVKVKPIGKSGQFVKFDPETMQAAGGAPIQAGERVKITYRGSRVTLPGGEVVDVVKPVVVREPVPVKVSAAQAKLALTDTEHNTLGTLLNGPRDLNPKSPMGWGKATTARIAAVRQELDRLVARGLATETKGVYKLTPLGRRAESAAQEARRARSLAQSVDESGLRRLASETPATARDLEGGAMGQTRRLDYGNGQAIVEKVYGGQYRTPDWIAHEVDAEVLSADVLRTIGVRVPTVADMGNGRLAFELIDEQPWGRIAARDTRFGEAEDAIAESPEGRLLGLGDYLIGNADRHAGNWLMDWADRLVAIDHGEAFRPLGGGQNVFEHFAAYLRGKGKLTAKLKGVDTRRLRAELEALAPRFAARGRTDWFNDMMDRLDEVERRMS